MGMKYVEESFNMGMIFYLKCPSKWVPFQTPNTHIRAFLYWSRQSLSPKKALVALYILGVNGHKGCPTQEKQDHLLAVSNLSNIMFLLKFYVISIIT